MTLRATSPAFGPLTIRKAEPRDCDAIAELHIASMQRTYQAFLSEEYLTNEMPPERRARWTLRFTSPSAIQYLTLVAEEDTGELGGFACLVLDPADRWGTLIDGLHISPRHQRRGLGRQLLASALADLDEQRAEMSLHLLVYEDNRGARQLYDSLQGKIAERLTRNLGIAGDDVTLFRYVWENPATLLNQLAK